MIKDKIASLYKNGFFHIFAGNILNKLFAYISSIVIVRLVSKEDYAGLAYVDNIYSYATLFAGMGMASAILKYCSSDNQRKNLAYLKISLKYGIPFQIGIVFFIIILAAFFEFPFPGVKGLVLFYCLYPIMEYCFLLFQSVIRALLQSKLYVKMSVIQMGSVMAVGIVLAMLIGVKGVLAARYIAVLLAGGIGAASIIKQFKGVQEETLSRSEIKAFLSMSVSLLIANLFSMVMPLNETFLINNLIRDEVVTANYKVATMFPAQLTFITSSLMVYYFPIIARADDKKEVWKLSKKMGLLIGVVILAIVVCGVVLSKNIILAIYGERYYDAVELSRIFWVVYSLNAGFRMLPMNILPAIGRAKFNAIAAGVTSIIHFGIDYFMIANYGIVGVAVATTLMYLLSGIAYWIYLYISCRGNEGVK